MSKLELILLGRFECLLPSGQRVTLAMRKAEALLAFLALAPGLRHPRERLVNLLWSDRGEEQARNSLRQCLSAIRKSLGEAADLALQIDRTTVCLNGELVEVDAHEFERLAALGDYESLVTAADLYQGEFLEGISIRDAASQEWLESERSRFKRQFVEILHNLAETQLVSHDFGNAIRSAERLVEQDPLGEAGWRLLMQAYSDNGQRGHALQAFKRCAQTLRSELEIDPEAATTGLRERIASGGAGARPAPAAKSSAPEPPRATHQAAGDPHAIVVLPFDNLSGDPEQEYFSDGITDSIIMNLGLFPGLRVKSRNSSFAFKQQIKSLGEISRELGVGYVVEGSVRRSAGRIRVNVQLVEAASGNQVWSRRYDSDPDDLFELEESLSRSIAATVTGKIESELQRIAIAKGAADQQAYDLLLAGTYYAHRFNRQDNVTAIERLRQCLGQDPDNVRAHVFLYICHHMDYLNRWTVNYQASFEQAGMHIRKALALGPELALVHSMYAEYLNYCEKFEEAEKHLDRALAINPNDPDAIITMVWCRRNQGDDEAALALAEKACQLDPYHPWAEWRLMSSQYLCGKYEDALATAENFRTSPGFTHLYGIATLVRLGMMEKARQTLRTFLQDCRETMLSMPKSLAEWRQFIRENFPFPDPRFVDDLVDCLLKAGLEDAIGGTAVPAADVSHTIAVLPFDNLSGDPEQEYFSDGISESIILNLALFPDLHVKSRNSSFAFKQQLKGLAEISRELDVDYVVEGSIRKSKDRIRITAQLIDAASGNQVWGKRYDAGLEDLFHLEEELSREIAATVTGRIESELQRVAIAKGAADQQAYDLLLAGIHHVHQFTREDTLIAIEKLNRCLQKDPRNVRAHKQLYSCHLMNYLDRWSEDHRASFELAAEHIDRAIALAPQSDDARIFYAQYLVFRGEFERAADFLDKALENNPNNPDALTTVALNLEMQGKAEEALAAAERSCRLDPYHPWAEWEVAVSLFVAGEYARVVETISKMRTSPGFIRIFGISANVRLDRIDAARRELQAFLAECRATMITMPQTRDEWLEYTRENYPFTDPQINQGILDDMLRAGLDEQDMTTESASSSGSRVTSIAVLPFDNLSGDPEQEYFSDGITESIILNLALFPGLHVKSRNSSFAFKQQLKGLAEISQELDVDYVVEGSIRKLKERVRITAQLIDAASGNQVWGNRYETGLEDLFDVEEELSREIAATVTGRIRSELQRVAIAKGAADQQAYDWLLAGMYHVHRFNAADNDIAIEMFERCLAQDPGNVRAHTGLYICYSMAYLGRWIENYGKSYDKAWDYIRRAMKLDPEDRSAQLFHAEMLAFSSQLDKARRQIDKVLENNPNDPDALAVLANIYVSGCDFESARTTAGRALKLDPYHPWAEWELAVSTYHCGDFEGAIEAIETMRAAPGFITLYAVASLVRLERIDRARETLQDFMRECEAGMKEIPRSIEEWFEYTRQNYPFTDAQLNRDLVDMLVQAGLEEFYPATDGQAESESLPSIAVLPFENMSGDPEQEHFADGITTDIIATLSRFRRLRTVSRYSTQHYKTDKAPIADIAAQQGVRYVLEGSVRKSGARIRVSAELIDAGNGEILWAERYDRDLDDLFAVQDEITRNISIAMKVHFDEGEKASYRSAGTRNIRAWELTLIATDLQDTYVQRHIEESRSKVREALAIDPEYAFAWVILGWTYFQEAFNGSSDSIEASVVEAEKANRRALEFGLELAEGWSQSGAIQTMKGEPEKALHDCQRALELEPGNAEVQVLMAFVCVYAGDLERARKHNAIMLELCPIPPNWYYMPGGMAELLRGNRARAIEIFRRGIEAEPDSPLCRFFLLHALMENGDAVEAGKVAEQIRRIDAMANGRGLLRAVSCDAGTAARFRASLERFDLC